MIFMANNSYCEGCNCGSASNTCRDDYNNKLYHLVDTRPPIYDAKVVAEGFYKGLDKAYVEALRNSSP